MPPTDAIDRDLIAAWAAGRSRSRGHPAPVLDGDAVRVDTGLPVEQRRYIFAASSPAIHALAATIDRPAVVIKLCAPLADLLALLPAGWRGHPQSFFMACDGPMRAARTPLPPGYRLTSGSDGGVLAVQVVADDGGLAARGRAVAHAGVFVYDQIATDPGHRRRGLGGHVMNALAAERGGARQVLTATPAGHALYRSLGWTTLSLYSTAERDPVPGSAEASSTPTAAQSG